MQEAPLGNVVTARGVRIWFDPTDRRGVALRDAGGDVNPSSTRLWRAAVELAPFRCVVDVGANYGEMLAAADLSRAESVLAYEPNVRLLPALERTALALDERIRVRPVALGSVPETSVPFAPHPDWSGKGRVVTDPAAASGWVRSTTLDQELPATPATLVVKIDVEGGELGVIAGMHRLMQEADLVVIMLEILHMSIQQVSELTRTWPTYVLDERSGDLVRLPTNDPLTTGSLLHEGHLHRENAVLVAGREAAQVIAAKPELRRPATSPTTEREHELATALRTMTREVTRLRATLARRSVRIALRLADGVPDWARRLRRRDR